MLDPAQSLIVRHERHAASECGCCDHPVGGISGKCVAEPTGTLGVEA
jgi:hypothetical protein